MIRKASIAAMVTLGLALAGGRHSPALAAFQSSTRRLEQCFRGVRDTSSALNPMERLVFGLILANTDAPQRQPARGAVPTPRI
jgi:hypothetical protein